MSLDKLLEAARKAASKPDSPREPSIKTRREPSKNERDAQYTAPGFGILFCCHKVSYFEPCQQCKRDTRKANLLLTKFLEKHG